MKKSFDIIIVGAGLVGLATAYQLKLKVPLLKILILEKEHDVALHQSGHNSGVIHSGIYYKPGSLKASNCIKGYQALLKFAEENGINHDICGKIIVATEEKELPLLDTIYKRGLENGLQNLTFLNQDEISETEPFCKGLKAVRVPQAGIIDYPQLARKILEKFLDLGGDIIFNEKVEFIKELFSSIFVTTQKKVYESKKVITCGGLYSDTLSLSENEVKDLIIIPFRGEYYKIRPEKKHLVNNLIYPVPDPNFPFLGVHFTRMINGGIEAGPNAILAFKKEGYKFFDINPKELINTLTWPGFHKIVMKYGITGMGEIYRSLSKKAFTQALQKLIPEIKDNDLIPGGAGVRAQACDRQGNLLDDFNIVKKGNIIHVRNAPSPAATSCLSIGEYLSDLAIQ